MEKLDLVKRFVDLVDGQYNRKDLEEVQLVTRDELAAKLTGHFLTYGGHSRPKVDQTVELVLKQTLVNLSWRDNSRRDRVKRVSVLEEDLKARIGKIGLFNSRLQGLGLDGDKLLEVLVYRKWG